MSDPIDVSSLADSSEASEDTLAVRVSELAADFLWLDNREVKAFLSELHGKYGDRFDALKIFHDPIHKLEYHDVLDAMASAELELVAAELDSFAKQKSQRLELQQQERYAEEQALTVAELRLLYSELDAASEFTQEQLLKAYERCLNSETLPLKIEESLEQSFRQTVFSKRTVENLVIMQLVLGIPEPLVERDLGKFTFYLDKVEARLREEVTPLIDGWLSFILRRAFERHDGPLSYPPAPRFQLEALLAAGLPKRACIYYILLDRAKGTEQLIIDSIAEIQGKPVSEVASAYTRVFRTFPETKLPSYGPRSLAALDLEEDAGKRRPPAEQQGLLLRLAAEQGYALTAADDAMAAEIKAGDVIFLDPEHKAKDGDLVLARYRVGAESQRVVRRYVRGSDYVQLLPDRLGSDLDVLTFRHTDDGLELDGAAAELEIEAVVVGLLRRYHPGRCASEG